MTVLKPYCRPAPSLLDVTVGEETLAIDTKSVHFLGIIVVTMKAIIRPLLPRQFQTFVETSPCLARLASTWQTSHIVKVYLDSASQTHRVLVRSPG